MGIPTAGVSGSAWKELLGWTTEWPVQCVLTATKLHWCQHMEVVLTARARVGDDYFVQNGGNHSVFWPIVQRYEALILRVARGVRQSRVAPTQRLLFSSLLIQLRQLVDITKVIHLQPSSFSRRKCALANRIS